MNRIAALEGRGPHAPRRAAGACALGIMTKAPQAGHVKTRLVPPLSPAEASTLHACFLADTAANIAALARTHACQGIAVYTPPGSEALLARLLPPGFRLVCQRGDGLGHRLRSAAADALGADYAAVCLIDADSPTLPAEALVQAMEALARPGDRLVLGPADDGGYYLIGLKAPHPALFEDIDWSTGRVLAQTLARAEAIGLETVLLPPWYDVDDAEALRRLCDELFPRGAGAAPRRRGYPAPETRRYLARLLEREGPRRWLG
jgi:rSAM/selenodomain-associated transferase 1